MFQRLRQELKSMFFGWWVVVACFFISLYAGGAVFFGFTALFEPIVREFGWDYAQVSFAASLRTTETGLLGPLLGLGADRYGPRRMLFLGALLIGMGLLLLSRVQSLGMFYLAFVILSFGFSGCSATVVMTAVSNWFRRRVAKAVAIVASGFAAGGLLVPVIVRLIDWLDWRNAIVALAIGSWVILIPLSLLVRHKPEQYGYVPDGAAFSEKEGRKTLPEDFDVSPSKAVRSRPFWHIAITLVCHAFVINAVMTHVMPYLTTVGIPRTVSGMVAGAIPVASIAGRLIFGWIGDRLDKRHVAALAFGLATAGLLLFGQVGAERTWLVIPFVVVYGLGWGAEATMRPALVREYFGRKRFGTIHGFIIGVLVIGHLTGAPVAGWAFDRWGSYHGVWFAYAGVTALGAMIILATPASHWRARKVALAAEAR